MPENLQTAFGRGRANHLNLMRLGLAVLVVVSHAWPVGWYGPDPQIGATTLGTIAVMSFFGVSGFLVTGSAQRLTVRRFLWHRFLRLMPGYVVCLLVIAAVIAPLAWLSQHGSLIAYPVRDAVSYVASNLTLKSGIAPTIEGTQALAPAASRGWNGAAWSLFFEMLFYVGVAVLAALRRLTLPVVSSLFLTAVVLLMAWEAFPRALGSTIFHYHDIYRLVTTGCVFSAGMILRLADDRVPLTRWLFAAGLAFTTLGLLLLSHPEWLIALWLVYVLLYLAVRVPGSTRAPRNDASYGVYIYGFPVASLLALVGVNDLGVPLYLGATLILVFPLALLSWFVVEKPALRLKDVGRAEGGSTGRFGRHPRAMRRTRVGRSKISG